MKYLNKKNDSNINSFQKQNLNEPLNLHSGHRNRLRQSFINNNYDSLNDHQLLELLLFYALPRVDTNVIAHRLLNTFGSLSGILNAKLDHLKNVEGIGENAAVLLKLLPELMRRSVKKVNSFIDKINSLSELGNFLIQYFALESSEESVIICVNKNKKVTSINRLKFKSKKSEDNALDEIISICVSAKPHTVVMAHLHPDGCLTPSRDDELFTYSLKNALEALRILLMEHFVITHDGYTRILNSLDYDISKSFK